MSSSHEVVNNSNTYVLEGVTTEVSVPGNIKVCTKKVENSVVAKKKEFAIVSDAFYIGETSGPVPTWLNNLVESLVSGYVEEGLTDYDLLIENVRAAIDAIDVAKNTFVSQIGFHSTVNGIIGTRLETLNTTYEDKFATILSLQSAVSNSEFALASAINDIRAEYTQDINSRITSVEQAFAADNLAFADSITALTSSFADQERNIQGNSDAVSGLQTYIGLDTTTANPNGYGMLARLDTLEKQTDGIVDIVSNTYDVMLGIEDPNNDTSNDTLVKDALPYVLWTTMEGTGNPSGNLRTYKDYAGGGTLKSTNVLENTFYIREDFTDVNLDRYYKYSAGTWNSVTEVEFLKGRNNLLDSHLGDVYIKYSGSGGTKEYLKSFKFIKTTVDETSPYSTDTFGYTWAVVTDTDSQAIYVTALNARDMADGKVSNFYAWGDGENGSPPANISVETSEGTETVSANNVRYWFTGNNLYLKGADWNSKTLVPKSPGSGTYIDVGDILTVFDPIERDITTYWFNGTSWLINSPNGLIAKSKWFVDLENDVRNENGLVLTSINSLKIESENYADQNKVSTENKFIYGNTIKIGDKFYKSSFGLVTTGGGDGNSEGTAFDSEFTVNAKTFTLTNPDHPGVKAKFNVTDSGLMIGLDNTEATRNDHKGAWNSSTQYLRGDVVTRLGSSWMAKQSSTNVVPSENSYWGLLSEKGDDSSTVAGDITWIDSSYNNQWNDAYDSTVNEWVHSNYGRYPITGDRVTITNNNISSPKLTTKVATSGGDNANWIKPAVLLDGSLVARGTVAANALQANALKIGDNGEVQVDESGIKANMLEADAISGKSGVFGSGDNVVRLNQNSEFPLWFGHKDDTVNAANAIWFVDSSGNYKKDIAAIIWSNFYLDSQTTYIEPTRKHFCVGGDCTVTLRCSGNIKRTSGGSEGFGTIGVSVERSKISSSGSYGNWVSVGYASGALNYSQYGTSEHFDMEIDTIDAGMELYKKYAFRIVVQILEDFNFTYDIENSTISGKFNTNQVSEY